MDVGIGMPSTIPGADGRVFAEWARASEEAGFSSLGTIDRVAYPNYEPLVTLAAAAAVTERIRLVTSILLAPLRPNTALLAKQAASVDNISGGRLTLGLAVGAREDDYEASGVDMHTRGRVFDEQLEHMKRLWAGENGGVPHDFGPDPVTRGGPTIITGGQVEASYRRAARHGAGWIAGGLPPDMFRDAVSQLREVWSAEGREDQPRTMALAYFALGPDARADADRYLKHYYAFMGEFAEQIAQSAAVSEEMVQGYVSAFEDAGCDELILFPCSADMEQVRLLREALG